MVAGINRDAVEWVRCGLNGKKDKLIYNTMVLLIRISLGRLRNICRLVMGLSIFMENRRRMHIWV